MIRRAVAVLAAGALVLTLAACAPDAGSVAGKDHDPGHYIYTSQCISTGKTVVCHPVPIWDSEDWRVLLVDGDDKGWVDVDEGVWDELKIGDYYDTNAGKR